MKDVRESINSAVDKQCAERRKCFLKLLSNACFLARQGLAFRGDSTETDSNFFQLLCLRSEDNSQLVDWVKQKANKYTSPQIQNEMLETMAMRVLRDIAKCLQTSPFFSLMVDETTDSANCEQVVVCLRWISEAFEVNEDFVGLYEVPSTGAETIFSVISDVLARFNLPYSKVRGQCYDGAASMAGRKSGIATRILKVEPRAVYTHCYGHSLNLACSDSVKGCKVMRDALWTPHMRLRS